MPLDFSVLLLSSVPRIYSCELLWHKKDDDHDDSKCCKSQNFCVSFILRPRQLCKEITSREQMTREHYYAAVSVLAQQAQKCQNEGRQTNFIALTAKIKGFTVYLRQGIIYHRGDCSP